MARRKFALPGIQDLGKDQEDARALPKEGQHLIIGGPGTGKSVLALLRSRRHHQDGDKYIFLVYNRLLHQASVGLVGDDLASQTWHRWFGRMFFAWTGQRPPRLPAESPSPGAWRDIDWNETLKIIGKIGSGGEGGQWPYLIIDEGQDMPPEFYQALVNRGFENFYVVADQNQQIVSGRNSSRQDIENVLAISPDRVIELRENYRNSFPTARLAREFYTGDPASPPPDLPPPGRAAKRALLLEYGRSRGMSFPSLIGAIVKTADRDPSKLLGIITPNNDVRERYLQALQAVDLKLDNGMPKIRTYAHGEDAAAIAFDEGGIMVINAQSCKGLEFDKVFVADIDRHHCPPGALEEKKRLFYVMTARARENVILLKNADQDYCPVESIIPNNPDILEIRR